MTTDTTKATELDSFANENVNGKTPRRGEEGRGQGRESRTSQSVHETARQPERVPMYAQRHMLNTDMIPAGYHGHWVADSNVGKIDMMKRAGYNFVTKDQNVYSDHVTENGIDSRVSKSGSDNVTLYLMIIPLELYEADQEAKNARNVEQTNSIFGKQRNDPDFYSRDEHGNNRPASQGVGRITTNDYSL